MSFPPPLNDQTFTTTLKYLIERWRDSSQTIELDRKVIYTHEFNMTVKINFQVTLDEIATSFSLFILTKSLESHMNLLTTEIPSSILEVNN